MPVLSPQNFQDRLALAVSFLLHPFLISPATILLLAGRASAVGFSLAIVIPLFVLTAIQVRRGSWTNFDVSVRAQRRGLYWPGLILTAGAAAVMYATGSNPGLLSGFIVATAMIAVAMAINRLLKLSLHMTFAAFSAVTVGWTYPRITPLIVAVLVLLAWSRLRLQRHTLVEVIAGTVLGLVAGWVLVLL
jgi:hypothetical protein